jgi:hypothetical protein
MMKNYKSFLLVTTFVSVLLPASLSAYSSKQIADDLRDFRQSSHVVQVAPIEEPSSGWFSYIAAKAVSAKNTIGIGLHRLGEAARTENTRTATGNTIKLAKQAATDAITAKAGLPVELNSEVAWNYLGNFCRGVASKVLGVKAPEKETSVLLDSSDLNRSSRQSDFVEFLENAGAAYGKLEEGKNQIKKKFYELVEATQKRFSYTALKGIDFRKILKGIMEKNPQNQQTSVTAKAASAA